LKDLNFLKKYDIIFDNFYFLNPIKPSGWVGKWVVGTNPDQDPIKKFNT
jgi:hypothetical protein